MDKMNDLFRSDMLDDGAEDDDTRGNELSK